MLNIVKGKQKRAVKLVITGSEGIGKSTLASKAPGALFVDTEGGSDQLDTARISDIDTWEKLTALPSEILKEKGICRTLVIDTADWAEQLCIRFVCRKNGVQNLENIGYGKGYTFLYEEFSVFLNQLNRLIDAGINVIVIAHAKLRKQELPDEMGAFDRWEMKLTRQVAPLIKEWGDAVLFCNYKTFVTSTESGSKKASGGKRVIFTTHHPCWDAKNRFGLEEELPLEYESIRSLFLDEDIPVSENRLIEELKALITEKQLQVVVSLEGSYPPDTPVEKYSEQYVRERVIPNIDRITQIIMKDRENTGKTTKENN